MALSSTKVARLFGMLSAFIVLGLFVLVSQSFATDFSQFVQTPNGGDILYKGSAYTIAWDNTLLPPTTPLEVWLSKAEDGSTLYVQKFADVTNSDHAYNWTIPSSLAEGGNYTISVRATNIPGAADSSNAVFAVVDRNAVGSLQFLTPLANEHIGSGKGRVISWRSPLLTSTTLRITQGSTIFYDRLLTENDFANTAVTSRNSNEMVVHIDWPSVSILSGTYTLQIITNQTTITREVTVAQASVIIEAPKGGEVWQVNETRNITWNTSNVSFVDLILYLDGQPSITIARIAATQKAYAWKIPTTLPTDDGYTIQVKDTASDRSATSERFTITNVARPTNNALLKTGHDPRVWAIERSRRHWIPTVALFDAYGYNWNNVRIVDKGELAYYPRAKVLRAKGGIHIFYITESGMKRHVPNPTVFTSYGNRWDDVIEVLPQELDAYPYSSLIRVHGDKKVYFLENGQKRWIRTAQAFNTYHFNWSMIAPVNQTELDAYPTGPDIY